jgi:methionyl-tRNA formyltransferase
LLAAPFRGVINCHHSLLPAYRGPQPVYWAIRNGETRTGVSVNVMTERIDEGTLLAQVAVQIFPTDTGGSVLAKLNEAASPLVADVVSQIARGETRSVNSMVDRASYFGGRTIDDVQIDWHRTSIEILNQLRAVRPWNGLECSVNGVPLLVRRAEAVACRPGRAGGVVSIKRRGLTVRTRDGGILLTDFSVRPLHGRTGQCGAILLLQLSQILSLTD